MSVTQQAVNVVARCVLCAGQAAVIEDPHYELVEHALLAHGARLVRVRVDAEGLVAERVIYGGTFSKTLFPGLRLGYIVCPPALRGDLYMAKMLEDLGCSSIEQAALASFLESRQYEKHLRESLAELRRRRQALLEGLSRHPGDRVHVAASAGGRTALGLYPIHHYYQKRPPRPGLMLGFAGPTPGQLSAAAVLLARCANEVAPVVVPVAED